LAKKLVQLHKRGRNGNWKVTKEKKNQCWAGILILIYQLSKCEYGFSK
jgi:hypothetical protein